MSRSAVRGATSRAGSIQALKATGSAAMPSSSAARPTSTHGPRAERAAGTRTGVRIAPARDGVGTYVGVSRRSELEVDEAGTLEHAERHDGEHRARVRRPANRRSRTG